MAVVKKKKKNKPSDESAAARLDEIQSRGDDLAEWIGDNPVLILGAAGAILALAAIYGLAASGIGSSGQEASRSIALVKSEFRQAMGGAYSGSFEVPEPANPEAARSTREEYVERFKEIAAEHEGTQMGGYALVQAASLQADLEDREGALASFERALEPYGKDEPMRGIILERIAALHEQGGDLKAATAAHLEASAIVDFPLRYFALLGAARSQAEAGLADAAIANFERVTQESPDLLIPEHTQAMLLELKARRSL